MKKPNITHGIHGLDMNAPPLSPKIIKEHRSTKAVKDLVPKALSKLARLDELIWQAAKDEVYKREDDLVAKGIDPDTITDRVTKEITDLLKNWAKLYGQ